MNVLSARLDPMLLHTHEELDAHIISEKKTIEPTSAIPLQSNLVEQDSTLHTDTAQQGGDSSKQSISSKRNLPGIYIII